MNRTPAQPRLPALADETSPVLVGFSGGLDSSVLLRLLAESNDMRARGLRAIHVHHGLSPQADAWASHCQSICTALGIPLYLARVCVADDTGAGREAAARLARHAAFEAELRDSEVLALAHHRDDQAETLLLRALRASGPDGLAAMRPWRRFGRGWLWRPLLDTPRAHLLAYAQTHALEWIDDDGNADTSLDRNFLRHEVLPLLRTRWPHADNAFARVATLQAEAVTLLGSEDALALASVHTADASTIRVEPLQAIPPGRRARVLRHWISALGLPPLPAQGIDLVERDLLNAAQDREAAFAWAGASIRRWRNLLHAGNVHPPLPNGWSTRWDFQVPLSLPDGGSITLLRNPEMSADAALSLQHDVVVHARRGGERIVLPGRKHSHALKHVLQDLGVPPWEREHLPLLSDPDGTLLSAGDLVISAGFDTWLREHGARLHWNPHAG